MPLIFLTENDAEVLKQLIADFKKVFKNTGKYLREDPTHQAPETYVALPQAEIPARSGDTPGKGDADIYTLDNSTEELYHIVGYDKEIYNLTTTALNTTDYIPIWRDKYGPWIASPGGSAAAVCDFIRFRIISADVVSSPKTASVDILSRPCNCTVVSEEVAETGTGTGETLTVYDYAGCYLNEPAADLVGRIGYAKYMIDENNEEFATGTGTETIQNCNWEVTTLCCPTC